MYTTPVEFETMQVRSQFFFSLAKNHLDDAKNNLF